MPVLHRWIGIALGLLLATSCAPVTDAVPVQETEPEAVSSEQASQPSSDTVGSQERSPSSAEPEAASLPEVLSVQKGAAWEHQAPANPVVSNGPIVVSSGGSWTAYDEQLVEISSGVVTTDSDASGNILASSWPGVAVSYSDQRPWVIDVESGATLTTDLLFHVPDRARLPLAPRTAWDAIAPAEGVVVDFTTMTSAPIPSKIERTDNPPMSPDGEFLLVDGRDGSTSRWRVEVRPTQDPAVVLWSYDAPEGVRFLSAGRFDAKGDVVLRARADGSTTVVEYGGRPGEDLERLDPLHGWSERHPGVPLRPDGPNAVVVTDDGTETRIGSSGEAELACEATGWDVAVRTGEILFFTAGFEETVAIASDTPRDVFVEEQGVVAWLMTNRNQGQREVIALINCSTREILDPTEVGVALGVGAVSAAWIDHYDNTDNGALLSIVESDAGDAILLSDDAGALWSLLRTDQIYDISLSPDGLYAAATYSWNGQDALGILPTSGLENGEITSLPIDQPATVAWLLG